MTKSHFKFLSSFFQKLNNIAARKEQLLKNKEEIIKSRQRLELIKSKTSQRDNNMLVSPLTIS